MALRDKEAARPTTPSSNSYFPGDRLVQKVWLYTRITRSKLPEIKTAKILEVEQCIER